MQKRILIALNLCLLVILIVVLIYFYPVIESEATDPDKQHTIIISQTESAKEVPPSDAIVAPHNEPLQVAFLVSDLGINNEVTNKALEILPKTVALGFSLYGDNLEGHLEKDKSHDILLHLPIQRPEKPIEALLSLDNHVSNEENLRRLSMFLAQGKNNYMGVYTDQIFPFNKSMVHGIMKTLQEKGKVLCYSGCDKTTKYMAFESGIGFTMPDLFITYDANQSLIKEQLQSIALIHKFQSKALVLVQPSAVTIAALSEFLQQEHDFQVISIAEMVKDLE